MMTSAVINSYTHIRRAAEPLRLTLLLSAALTLTNCAPSRSSQAEQIYGQAVEAFSAKKIGAAKVLLDSIRNCYPDVPAVYRDARELYKAVAHYESERTIAFLDSMLQVCEAERQTLLKDMVIDDPEAPSPRYIAKSQQAFRSFDRCLVKASSDINGEFSLISVYTGEKAVHHNRFTARVGDEFVELPEMDELFRNEFSDGESVWETVRYTGHEAADVAKFIVVHQQDRVLVEMLGEKSRYLTYLTDVDKEAIAKVWSLSCSLRESRKIKGMIRSSRLEMTKQKM